jgi:hypothetical protein
MRSDPASARRWLNDSRSQIDLAPLASKSFGQRSSSALVGIDRAAPATEWALDLLAPATLPALATKSAKHVIEDVLGISDPWAS